MNDDGMASLRLRLATEGLEAGLAAQRNDFWCSFAPALRSGADLEDGREHRAAMRNESVIKVEQRVKRMERNVTRTVRKVKEKAEYKEMNQ